MSKPTQDSQNAQNSPLGYPEAGYPETGYSETGYSETSRSYAHTPHVRTNAHAGANKARLQLELRRALEDKLQ